MQEVHLRPISGGTSRPRVASPPPADVDSAKSAPQSKTRAARTRHPLRLWPYSTFVIVVWAVNLLLCEVWVYHHQTAKCAWPAHPPFIDERNVTRVVVIADPQITDINSYPFFVEHPWFGAFVCELSDRFMRKSFRILQWHRRPEHVVFAGDMMDQGRDYKLPDYLNALARFRAIFVDKHLVPTLRFYSVAGNHDIGFYTAPKRKEELVAQFERHFSALNYEHKIGSINWTFVAATEISLDPGFPSPYRATTVDFVRKLSAGPRIVVMHIPLWREQSENCTSLRQTNKQIPFLVRQTYATMLPRDTSDFVLSHAKPLLVFTGDDHDLCVVRHPGNVTELTVGTYSYMQGVMWPSYALVTQWNECRPSSGCRARAEFTVCWLPSQPYILIWYAVLGVLCILGLLVAVVTYAGAYARNPTSVTQRITAIILEFVRRLSVLFGVVALQWACLYVVGY